MPSQIDTFLAHQPIPGVVAVGVSRGDTLYEGAFGVTDTNAGPPIELQTPHALMSMTKPLTSVAALQHIEQGRIALDAPVRDYLPRYGELEVLNEVDLGNGSYTTTALEQEVTVRHLLTHTAGLGYTFCNETLLALRPESENPFFPLLHQPGAAWTYSGATRVLGELLEAVSGEALDEIFRKGIFEPLGMSETSFEVREHQARTHVMREGSWQPLERGGPIVAGDAGLVSTAPDYAKFVQCLLNEGAPLLSADTFRSMITNQIGELFVTEQPAANPVATRPFPRGAGIDKWGFGFQVHVEPKPGMRSPGSFSWCGLYNTYFWGDPVKRVGGVVLMQTLPLYEPVCIETLEGFERRFYERFG